MLYKFKSRATGDLIMTTPVGDRVLRAAGVDPSPQSIIEPIDMPIIAGAIIWLSPAIIAIIGSAAPGASSSPPAGRANETARSVNSGR